MKKIILLLTIVSSAVSSFGQKIDMIVLTGYGAKESIYYLTPDKISVVLTKDGNISEWGTDYGQSMNGYWPGRLNKYMGRVDYYGDNENEAFRGKVKYIGITLISYYSSYDEAASKGKVKSIGSTFIDYYPAFEDTLIKGKVKNIGGITITYFSSFDNAVVKGRLRSVGNTQFNWYTSFDDKAFQGKIKSIDNYAFTYHAFNEINGGKGMMKSGFRTKYINGINYYVRN